MTTSAAHLFKPRDGYRTRVSPAMLGPVIEYYLPASASGPVTLEILDASGDGREQLQQRDAGRRRRRTRARRARRWRRRRRAVRRLAADTPPAAAAAEAPDPEAAGGGGGGRGRGGPPPRVTKDRGMNRVAWDVRNSSGLAVPPGAYQARLKAGDVTQTQPFNVLIDPRIAAEGVTAADLKEQFDHNMRVRELSTELNQLLTRVRGGLTGANADKVARDLRANRQHARERALQQAGPAGAHPVPGGHDDRRRSEDRPRRDRALPGAEEGSGGAQGGHRSAARTAVSSEVVNRERAVARERVRGQSEGRSPSDDYCPAQSLRSVIIG